MSDFEINKLIDTSLGVHGGVVSFFIDMSQFVTDYCNNPSDMMPLVFEDGVDEELWENMVYNSNPLRAAAIVWLMMQGVSYD